MDPSSKNRLFITIWVLHGVALLVVLSRVAFQFRFARVFWIEDALSTLALLCLFGDGMLVTIMTIYASTMGDDVQLSPILPLMDSGALERTASATGYLMRLRFSETLIFWTCLWLLKASFLAMWHRTSNPTTRMGRAMWRIVVAITVLGFVAFTMTFSLACKSLNPIKCDNERSRWLSYFSLQFSTAVDIVTSLILTLFAMALVWRQKNLARTHLVMCGIAAAGCLVMVPAALRIQAITRYRANGMGYCWIYVWATIEASMALITCNVAEFTLVFATLDGTYKSRPSEQELGLVRRRASKESGTRPRIRFGRRQLIPLQPPLGRRRGVRTLVSVVPLRERDQSQLEINQHGILVTRDIDQRTASENSIYSADDASRSQILSYPGAFTPLTPSSLDGGSPSTEGPSLRRKPTSRFFFRND